MLFPRFIFQRFAMALGVIGLLAACAGSGFQAASLGSLPAKPTRKMGAVILKAPVLSFNDTGLSVSDGVTRNGLWAVDSADIGWEFSLDRGATWTRGTGSSFEVKEDGAKVIWVRARDDAGNTSEIVRVNCVLDTLAPAAFLISHQRNGVTNTLSFSGIEPEARWEYAPEPQGTWWPGSGTGLFIFGNGLTRLWLRQVDVAGNASAPQAFDLNNPEVALIEASNDPLQPSVLAQGLQTLLIHGVVSDGDSDFVRWDVAKGQQLLSLKWVHLVANHATAFYGLQHSNVFNAGTEASRMLAHGRIDASDLGRNVLANLSPSKLGAGPNTLMIGQSAPEPTSYMIEVMLSPAN